MTGINRISRKTLKAMVADFGVAGVEVSAIKVSIPREARKHTTETIVL
jgi:hypothetical protein